VQAGDPDKFALVPVIGPPTRSIISVVTFEFAHRNATLPVFPVTLNGIRCVASTTSVSAPGQNFCANRKKLSGSSRANATAWSIEPTKIGSAFVSGRPLILYTRSTADKLNGSADSP